VTNPPPDVPGEDRPWGNPAPGGGQPEGGWGAPPSGGQPGTSGPGGAPGGQSGTPGPAGGAWGGAPAGGQGGWGPPAGGQGGGWGAGQGGQGGSWGAGQGGQAGSWGGPPGTGPAGPGQSGTVGGQVPPYGAQLPSYGQFGGPQSNVMSRAGGELAPWTTRALGYLVDAIFVLIPYLIFYGIGAADKSTGITLVGDLWALAVGIWFSVQVGQTGASPGMRVMGLRCINKNSGQPIGGGLGFVRSLAHFLDSIICYIGWLWPLWDRDRQTLADKIMSTIVIKVPPQRFSLTPPKGN
jgi:uncharacterized RDD family membrane protein YckC